MAKMTLHIGANISGLQSALGRAKNLITGWAGKLGGALTAGGMAMFAKGAIDAANAVGDGSQRIGVSAESYQKLSYAAKQSGTDIASVESAFKKMSSTVTDAINGNKTAEATLNSLGISLDEVKGKSPERLFALMADALNQVSDSTQKAVLAQDIFGKGGMALIPMLGTYKKLGDEIETAGGIMSNEAVAAADAFNDSMNRLYTTLQALTVESGFIKWLLDVAEGMNALVSGTDKLQEKTGVMVDKNGNTYSAALVDKNDQAAAQRQKDLAAMGVEGEGVDNEVTRANAKRKKEAQEKVDRAAKAEQFRKTKEVDKLLEEYGKEQKKLEAEGIKEQQAIDGSIAALNQKIAIQKLINDGKEKEAAIQEALNDAESKGALTQEQRASIIQSAGDLFDLSKKDKTKTVDMEVAVPTDAVNRIGGSIGGAMNTGKQQVDLLKTISEGIKSLDQKTKYDVGGGKNIWP